MNVVSSSSSHVEAKHENIYGAHSGSNVTTCHLNSVRDMSKRSDVCARSVLYHFVLLRSGRLTVRVVREDHSHLPPKCIDDVTE